MNKLSKLQNIGKAVEKQLNDVGINTFDELKGMGSREAWLKIKDIDPSTCLNRLYALEGAILGIRWHNLPEDKKIELKNFYKEFGEKNEY